MAESHMYHGKETSYLTSFIHGMGNMCMAETPYIMEILYIPMMGSIFIKGHRRTILRLFSHGMDSTCTKGILQTILILSFDGTHVYKGNSANYFNCLYTISQGHIYKGNSTYYGDILYTFDGHIPFPVLMMMF